MEQGKGVVIKLAASGEPLDILLLKIGKMNSGRSTIQVFDPSSIINKMHLIGAYMNAVEAFKNKSNISKSLGLEMMLFAAMTRQISDAIKIVGAKNSREFVLFASSAATYNKVKPLIKSGKDFKPSKSSEAKTAKKFGISLESDLDQFILQKIAVSRLAD